MRAFERLRRAAAAAVVAAAVCCGLVSVPGAAAEVSPVHLEFGDVAWGTARTPVKTVSISRTDARVKSIFARARFQVVEDDCAEWVNNTCTIGIAAVHPAPGSAVPGRETVPITVSYTDGETEHIWVSATFLPRPPPAAPTTWLAISDVSLVEGSPGTRTASFTVRRSGVTAGPSSVQWATVNGTATSGGDYVAVPLTTLSFAAGETSKKLSVSVNGDLVDEANEVFSVRLSAPSGATISDDTGAATITDDDQSYLRISDASVVEGNAGATSASFTVRRTGSTSGTSTVSWATVNGTATSGSDYVAVPLTTLSFTAGETSKRLSVSVDGDLVDEANEVFSVRLSAPSGATISDDTAVGTIVDDEGVRTPGPATFLAVTDRSVTEGNAGSTVADFTVLRSGNTTGASSVRWATANATATAGDDYTAVAATTLTFAAGETAKTISVPVTTDLLDEADEAFSVVLSSPTNATVSDAVGRATIVDDEASYLAISERTLLEGESTGTALFTITRTGSTGGPSSVKWATSDGTATAGSDYTGTPFTTVSFGPAETSKTVSVSVLGDTLDEADERFSVVLAAASGASISDSVGTATLVDDDPTTALVVNDVVSHVEESPVSALFTITRSGNTSGSSSVQYATADGTAVAGTDYTAIPTSTVSFAPGERTKRIQVTVLDDTVDEPVETFHVHLSSPTGATVVDGTGTATMWDISPG